MKKTAIILSFLIFAASSCGQANKQNQTTVQNIVCNQIHTVEDTVRYQIGGQLHGLNFSPSDSITVIESFHYQAEWGLYRQYTFIVHNRHSYAHRFFSSSHLDSIYKDHMNMSWASYRSLYEEFLRPRLDSIQSRRIDPAIKKFNGFWIYLKEHNGDFYLNDDWSWHNSFHIADSIFTSHDMEGPYLSKIIDAISISENAISLLYDVYGGLKEPVRIELFEKAREIYRIIYKEQVHFIAPARAIHNFEIIQYTNTTGDLI